MTFSPAFKDDLEQRRHRPGHAGRRAGPQPAARPVPWRRVGLWFSAGNEVDLGDSRDISADPRIRVIALLMEGVKDGRRLTAAPSWRASAASPWWC